MWNAQRPEAAPWAAVSLRKSARSPEACSLLMFRRFLFASSVLLLLALTGLAWYVSNKGFTRKWRTYMMKEFRNAGVEIHIQRLTLDPFRGLVAKDVSIFDTRDRKHVIAWIDEILLGVNYANAMRGQTFLDSADLRDASLWLPLDPKNPDSPKTEITKLNARFFLPPQQIYLARAQADVHGIQVFASGRLIHPQLFHPKNGGENSILETGGRILQQMARLRYTGAMPTLSVEFSGDLAHPEQVQVDLRFTAQNVRRKNYELRGVSLVANCRNGVSQLQELRAVDAFGDLRATGTYDLQSQELAAHVSSTLHLGEMDRAYGISGLLDDWVLTERPELDINVQGSLAEDGELKVTGHLDVRGASYRHVAFNRLTTDFSWEPQRWSLRDFHLVENTGELSGDVICLPGEFRARGNGSVDPQLLAPLLKPEEAAWLNRFDFTDPPKIQIEIHGNRPSLNTCEANGEITHESSLYQGTPVAPARSEIRLRRGLLSIFPFDFLSDAGSTQTRLLLNFPHHEISLQKIGPDAPAAGENGD
jgi:hypothetical protein